MVITVERNEYTNRFHPFAWREAPLPSADPDETICRFKSKMHHTAGFETVEEARAFASGEMATGIREVFGTATLRLDDIGEMAWQPGEVPASVRWMDREGLEPVALPEVSDGQG